MSKKEKLKAWHEKHKRDIRDTVFYAAGIGVTFGSIYVGGRLHERKYNGSSILSKLQEKNGEYGIVYCRELKNGKPDLDTQRFLSWSRDDAKKVAEKLLALVTEDDAKES